MSAASLSLLSFCHPFPWRLSLPPTGASFRLDGGNVDRKRVAGGVHRNGTAPDLPVPPPLRPPVVSPPDVAMGGGGKGGGRVCPCVHRTPLRFPSVVVSSLSVAAAAFAVCGGVATVVEWEASPVASLRGVRCRGDGGTIAVLLFFFILLVGVGVDGVACSSGREACVDRRRRRGRGRQWWWWW